MQKIVDINLSEVTTFKQRRAKLMLYEILKKLLYAQFIPVLKNHWLNIYANNSQDLFHSNLPKSTNSNPPINQGDNQLHLDRNKLFTPSQISLKSIIATLITSRT